MVGPPVVSVVITFLNAATFIQEAIESVFAQSCREWELLLIDDGSEDNSTNIARKYSEELPHRVQYYEHPNHQNLGISASRNLGVLNSKGEYIAFLDADDVWMSNKLEEQVAILETHPEVDLLYGNSEYWFSWTDEAPISGIDYVPRLGAREEAIYNPPTLLPLFLRGKVAIPCPTSIIARRRMIQHVGGFEDEFTGVNNLYEDQAFYAKACLHSTIFASNRCWDKYRQHKESIVTKAAVSGQNKIVRRYYLHWLTGYLEDHKVTDQTVWIAVKKEQWLNRHYRYPADSFWIGQKDTCIRWLKKWLLRLEESILPLNIQFRVWGKIPPNCL